MAVLQPEQSACPYVRAQATNKPGLTKTVSEIYKSLYIQLLLSNSEQKQKKQPSFFMTRVNEKINHPTGPK